MMREKKAQNVYWAYWEQREKVGFKRKKDRALRPISDR